MAEHSSPRTADPAAPPPGLPGAAVAPAPLPAADPAVPVATIDLRPAPPPALEGTAVSLPEAGGVLPERGAVVLAADLAPRAAVVKAFADELAYAAAAAAVAQAVPEAAVHAFRKSLRRARALLRLARSGLPEPTFAELTRVLSETARRTSALRDADVLPAALQSVTAAGFLAGVGQRLQARRDAVHASGEVQAVLRQGADVLQGLPATLETALRPDLDWAHLEDGLRETYRRARAARRATRKHPGGIVIHDWRKRCKELRYQMDLLVEPDGGGKPARRLHQAAAVARDLGHVTDLVALRQWATDHGAADGAEVQRRLQKVLKAAIGQQLEAAVTARKGLFADKPKEFAERIVAAARARARVPEVVDPSEQFDIGGGD